MCLQNLIHESVSQAWTSPTLNSYNDIICEHPQSFHHQLVIPNKTPLKIITKYRARWTGNNFSFLFQLSLFHSYSSACCLTMFIPWILIQRVKKYIQSLLHITKSWKFYSFYWILNFSCFFSFFLRFVSKKVYFPAFLSLVSGFGGEEFNRCPKKFMRSFKKIV